MRIYLDGIFVEEADARISVFDHGLLYGDGIFEGIRLYGGCVFRLEDHLIRLEHSAKAILLRLPLNRSEMREAVCETCRQNRLKDGYIRLLVTRGKGSLGLSPDSCPRPSVIIIADKIQLYPPEVYTRGLTVVTVPTRRNSPASLPPAVKSLNYLNNVLAKMEANRQGAHEALLLNEQGWVAECSGDNIFAMHDGILHTPDAAHGALKGITRRVVMELAEELGIPVREGNLTRYDIWTAEELFLTGTAAEVVPVTQVDGRIIGHGGIGDVTRRFLDAFHERVMKDGTML